VKKKAPKVDGFEIFRKISRGLHVEGTIGLAKRKEAGPRRDGGGGNILCNRGNFQRKEKTVRREQEGGGKPQGIVPPFRTNYHIDFFRLASILDGRDGKED